MSSSSSATPPPRRAQIVGTGLYAPARVVPNAYFDALYGEDVDGFLRAHRNIAERRYAAEDEAPSDLAVQAVRAALARAGRAPEDVDLLIVATDTPDYVSPSTASVVQHKLGATRAVAFDLNAACAGFVTALEVGRTFVEAGAQHDTVVVASPYLMSRFLDYEQKNTATLFADGAAAVVLRPTDGPNAILGARLRSEGQYHGHMGIYVGGGARPARCLPAPVTRDETREARSEEQRLEFRLAFPEHYNRDRWTALVRALTADLGVTPADVDRYVFTQINIGSIRDTLDALGVPHHRAHNVMDRYGYTGSACIPMALADADAKGLLHAGDLVMLVASGGGAALACLALRWASR